MSFTLLWPLTIKAEEEQGPKTSVELNGDVIEYSVEGNKMIASGNVIIVHKGTTLTCDKVEFFQDSQMANAFGNVRLKTATGEISGDQLSYNFGSMTGDFSGARIVAKPYYGEGKTVSKVDENKLAIDVSSVTTCDLDKPHYKLASKKMDVYPGDKMVARNVRLLIGKIPFLYLPRFTHSLKKKKPIFLFTPGHDKEWGNFLLTAWNHQFNEYIDLTLHLDYRTQLDLASGFDVAYKTPKNGSGILRTYYTNERRLQNKDNLIGERTAPTKERERFKIEWRHKWNIDKKTSAIMQYYKLSDSEFLRDFFERENEEDVSPNTFFLLTRALPKATLSFRTDVRVNRFESAVERLPEVRFDLANQQLWNTGLYLKNTTTYSNLTKKTPSPSEIRQNTMRLHINSELSYPKKVGIIEFKPFVGGSHTYYSKTKEIDKYDSIRGAFRTGASLSTKFFRVFDVKSNVWGLDIDRLRHIITPSIDYGFSADPTIPNSVLDSFDSIDSITKSHKIIFSLENKLQTKRNDKSVDLLRAIISTPFNLKEDAAKGGFGAISTDIDFRPTEWLTLYFDSSYDTKADHLSTANFDLYINGGEKWSWQLGKRYNRDADDQVTSLVKYKLNQKWALSMYDRFDIDVATLKEQEYIITRDLHAWEMDISFNQTRGRGNELLLVFRLKAFPDIGFDVGSSFNKRKAGSQSVIGK